MLTINIQIENADFEAALAKRITLSEGADLSKEMTNYLLHHLKEMAYAGLDQSAEEQILENIKSSVRTKKDSFDTLLENIKTIKR